MLQKGSATRLQQNTATETTLSIHRLVCWSPFSIIQKDNGAPLRPSLHCASPLSGGQIDLSRQ